MCMLRLRVQFWGYHLRMGSKKCLLLQLIRCCYELRSALPDEAWSATVDVHKQQIMFASVSETLHHQYYTWLYLVKFWMFFSSFPIYIQILFHLNLHFERKLLKVKAQQWIKLYKYYARPYLIWTFFLLLFCQLKFCSPQNKSTTNMNIYMYLITTSKNDLFA